MNGNVRRVVSVDMVLAGRADAWRFTTSRQPPLLRQPTPPATIVRIALERTGGQFVEKGLRLRETVADGLPLVQADPGRAAQALTNLLTNAARDTPAPG